MQRFKMSPRKGVPPVTKAESMRGQCFPVAVRVRAAVTRGRLRPARPELVIRGRKMIAEQPAPLHIRRAVSTPNNHSTGPVQRPVIEVVILAGGLSARMGRDKARLRLGGSTLLAHVRAAASATGWPVRVVRRDLGPRSGPLGGVWTAFQRSRAGRLVFLPCDLPFVTAELIRRVGQGKGRAVFTVSEGGFGFPFALARACLPQVERQLVAGDFSLQRLAAGLKARTLRLRPAQQRELVNVNTPADLAGLKRASAL